MSLAHTAEYLKKHGRGQDTELIHVSKKELSGLQNLAMAHGGSLTINPNTGLPEAGFLESVLPMVLGAGLAATGIGAPAAALLVGGGYGIAKGSLQEGLMAGLGAYGGAGLTAGLAGLGTEQIVKGAGETALKEAGTETALEAGKDAAAQKVQEEAAKQAALEGLPKTQAADFYRAGLNPNQIAQGQAQNFLGNAANTGNLSTETIQGLKGAIPNAANPLDIVSAAGQANAAGASNIANPSFGQSVANAGRGLGSLATSPSQIPGFVGDNLGAISALATPALMQDQKSNVPGPYQPDAYDRRLASYQLSPDYKAYEAPRPNPYYQAQYPSYADGGTVEQMSRENAMGGNTMFPQSGIGGLTGANTYQNATNIPMGSNVIEPTDAITDPYTGQMKFASGGVARYAGIQGSEVLAPLPESTSIPRTGIYRDTDLDTYKKDSLQAAIIKLGKSRKGAGLKGIDLPKTSVKSLGDVSGATPDTTDAAKGGVMHSHLGSYSDGGRMLKGPGDGMSDDIPATISGKQPARLADGEFVVPADVVSHLGNGSTDAGAKKLYGMMDKIRKARTGKKKQAPAVKADRFMPA